MHQSRPIPRGRRPRPLQPSLAARHRLSGARDCSSDAHRPRPRAVPAMLTRAPVRPRVRPPVQRLAHSLPSSFSTVRSWGRSVLRLHRCRTTALRDAQPSCRRIPSKGVRRMDAKSRRKLGMGQNALAFCLSHPDPGAGYNAAVLRLQGCTTRGKEVIGRQEEGAARRDRGGRAEEAAPPDAAADPPASCHPGRTRRRQ